MYSEMGEGTCRFCRSLVIYRSIFVGHAAKASDECGADQPVIGTVP